MPSAPAGDVDTMIAERYLRVAIAQMSGPMAMFANGRYYVEGFLRDAGLDPALARQDPDPALRDPAAWAEFDPRHATDALLIRQDIFFVERFVFGNPQSHDDFGRGGAAGLLKRQWSAVAGEPWWRAPLDELQRDVTAMTQALLDFARTEGKRLDAWSANIYDQVVWEMVWEVSGATRGGEPYPEASVLRELAEYPVWSDAFTASVEQGPDHVAGYLTGQLAAGIRRVRHPGLPLP
jgi:hypothetical protein